MSVGKSSSTTTPELSQEQKNDIAASTAFKTGTIIPTYQGVVGTALGTYNRAMPGVENAAQNLAGVGSQAQQTLGAGGESAYRTGLSGLESLFSPDYEANQIAAAMSPAQAQYMQNVQNQKAQFGGTGNLGSAREALAGQQLAGANQMNQMQLAAQIQNQIAQQRAGVGSTLAQLGQQGIQGAVSAAGVPLSASQAGTDYFNKVASVLYGVPQSSFSAPYQGSQGSTVTGNKFGISI
jgi:hypothetical protein